MPLYAALFLSILAQAANPVATQAPPPPMVPASNAPAAKAPGTTQPTTTTSTRTIVGEIVSVDPVLGLVVVARHGTASHESTPARPGESVTVTLDATTQIVKGKRPATLAELKAQDHAVVRYQLTPKGAHALSVRVADLLVRTPAPKAAAGPASPAVSAVNPVATPSPATGGARDK